jgi:hypothetical protein
MKILPETVSLKSSLKPEQMKDIEALADAIKSSIA